MMRLDGRVALVTGGAGHLGIAMSEALLELGATVVVADLERKAEVAAETLGQRSHGFKIDLSDPDAVSQLPRRIHEKHGRLDILIHSAALVGSTALSGWSVPFADQKLTAWRAALDVNLTAPFVLTQAAVPFLEMHGVGCVIFIGSIYGLVGPDWSLYEGTKLGNPAGYAASKGGLVQLMRWLATTVAPRIRVNCISPGGVERGQDRVFVDRYVRKTPLGRMAHEEDIKGAVAFLASDLAAYVTGQHLVVDGGFTAW